MGILSIARIGLVPFHFFPLFFLALSAALLSLLLEHRSIARRNNGDDGGSPHHQGVIIIIRYGLGTSSPILSRATKRPATLCIDRDSIDDPTHTHRPHWLMGQQYHRPSHDDDDDRDRHQLVVSSAKQPTDHVRHGFRRINYQATSNPATTAIYPPSRRKGTWWRDRDADAGDSL